MKIFAYSFIFLLLTTTYASAVTLANSSEEVEYTYEVSFRSLLSVRDGILDRKDALAQGKWHSGHMFGLLHSANYGERYGVPEDLAEGFAGTKDPEIEDAVSFVKSNDKNIWITYRAKAKMLVVKPVLAGWIGAAQSGSIQLPMLINMPEIYNSDITEYAHGKWVNCTDEYYNTPFDFSYFYNPFRCKEVGEPPIGEPVTLSLHRVSTDGYEQTKIPLKDIRGDNGNGELVMMYFVNGFYENPNRKDDPKVIQKDDGWKLYSSLGKIFVSQFKFKKMEGVAQFRKELGPLYQKYIVGTDIEKNPIKEHNDWNRIYFSTYVKKYAGRTYVIRMNLSNTENEQRSRPLKTFPKFWKEAWENGDFIYYGGHSGDGVSMNPEVMQNNLNKIFYGFSSQKSAHRKKTRSDFRLSTGRVVDSMDIRFQTTKTQIMLFDACSTYAHYQDAYRDKNPKLHLMTYGLVSLFHLAKITVVTLMDMIMNQKSEIPWVQVLAKIEENQLIPHMQYSYDMSRREVLKDPDYLKYKENKQYPRLLLNVSVPD